MAATFDIEILRSDNPEGIPTDNNVFSSLKTIQTIQAALAPIIGQYLSRLNPDEANGLIKFLAAELFLRYSWGKGTDRYWEQNQSFGGSLRMVQPHHICRG